MGNRIRIACWALLVFVSSLRAQPVHEDVKLTASDAALYDEFGVSVSISGDTAIVGAHHDDGSESDFGSAYVFERSGGSWSQTAKLTASDGAWEDDFGYSVSISGDTAIVGAWADDDRGWLTGSAYVFERSGGAWTQAAKLTASDGSAGDHFGHSVCISGDAAIIGASSAGTVGRFSGTAYVFQRSGATWVQVAKLIPSDAGSADHFGYSVSISGDAAIVGATGDDPSGRSSGSAYIFERTGGSWVQSAKLTAADGAPDDHFGHSVSVGGDTAVVGAPDDDDNGGYSGSAYIFERSGGAWAQAAKLMPSDGSSGDFFGEAVSVGGDRAIVGADQRHRDAPNWGAAYVFERSADSWIQAATLIASDGEPWDRFGCSVAISGDTAIAGAFCDDIPGQSGSAYVYHNIPEPATLALLGLGAIGLIRRRRSGAADGRHTHTLKREGSEDSSGSGSRAHGVAR